MAFAFRELKLVVEPGGAIGLAALLAGKLDMKGKVVVAVLSGGNVDAELFSRLIAALAEQRELFLFAHRLQRAERIVRRGDRVGLDGGGSDCAGGVVCRRRTARRIPAAEAAARRGSGAARDRAGSAAGSGSGSGPNRKSVGSNSASAMAGAGFGSRAAELTASGSGSGAAVKIDGGTFVRRRDRARLHPLEAFEQRRLVQRRLQRRCRRGLDGIAQRLHHRGQHRHGRSLIGRCLGWLRLGGALRRRSSSWPSCETTPDTVGTSIGFCFRFRSARAGAAERSAGLRRRRSRSWHRRGARTHRAARRRSRCRPPVLAVAMDCAISPSAVAQAAERGAVLAQRRLHAAERRDDQRGVACDVPCALRRARLPPLQMLLARSGLARLTWSRWSWSCFTAGSDRGEKACSICTIDEIEANRSMAGTPKFSTDRFALQIGAVLRRLFLFRRCPVAVFPALAGGEGARRAAPSAW